MPKYWVKNYFAHGRFPEVGQKQKTEKKERERERERAKVGENNGQATHGARKPPGPIDHVCGNYSALGLCNVEPSYNSYKAASNIAVQNINSSQVKNL